MRIRLRGREYPAVSIDTAQVIHLMELRAHSVQLVAEGLLPEPLGMAALASMQARLKEVQREMAAYRTAIREGREAGPEPVLPEEALAMFGVTLFLTLRAAGDAVSLRDALSVAFGEVQEVPEPTDVPAPPEGETDPQMPVPGGLETPGAGAAGPEAPTPLTTSASQ